MMPEPVNAKRPFNADRPFPRLCIACAKQSVNMAEIEYRARLKHDGRMHEFVLPSLAIPVCDSCGERIFTDEVERQLLNGLRRHLMLLTPEQIRSALEQLGISQEELACRLGIAEETVSRWISGHRVQSRSLDRLMRVFFALPQVRDALPSGGIDPGLGIADKRSLTDSP